MVRATYIEVDGAEHRVEADEGISLMEAARQNGVPGVDGDCGGACACATCHVHVDPDWFERTGPANEEEADLLEFANDPAATSRLSCQMKLSAALDGLIVRTPPTQR